MAEWEDFLKNWKTLQVSNYCCGWLQKNIFRFLIFAFFTDYCDYSGNLLRIHTLI